MTKLLLGKKPSLLHIYQKSHGHAEIKYGGKTQSDPVGINKISRMLTTLMTTSHAKLRQLQHSVDEESERSGVKF